VEAYCEHGNQPSGPMKDQEFLDWLSDYQLLREDSSFPWSYLGIITILLVIEFI